MIIVRTTSAYGWTVVYTQYAIYGGEDDRFVEGDARGCQPMEWVFFNKPQPAG